MVGIFSQIYISVLGDTTSGTVVWPTMCNDNISPVSFHDLFMKEEKSRKPPLREIWELLSKLSCVSSLTELFTIWHLHSCMNTNKYKYWDFILHFFVAAQTKQTLIEMSINRVLENYTVFTLLKEGYRYTDTCIERCPDERAKNKLKSTMYEMSLCFKKCIEIHNPYTYIDNFWKLYNKNYCRLRLWGLIEDLSLAILHLKFTLWFFFAMIVFNLFN